jgi:HEAT repeat protein
LALAPLRAEAQEVAKPSLEDLARKIAERGDLVDVDVVFELAAFESEEALRQLIAAYESFQTEYMRRITVGAMVRFAGHGEAEVAALAKLAELALARDSLEIAQSAVSAIASFRAAGHAQLRDVALRAQLADVRETALREHAAAAEPADAAWYRELWNPPPPEEKSSKKADKGKPKPPAGSGKATVPGPDAGTPGGAPLPVREATDQMREVAFDALAARLSSAELVQALGDPNTDIRSAALLRLESNGDARTKELAVERYENELERAPLRATAAAVIARADGRAARVRFVEDAGKAQMPRRLTDALAALVSAELDADLEKRLASMIGKGSHAARLFALQALQRGSEHKYDDSIAKALDEQEDELVLAAANALALRGAKAETPALRRALARSKEGSVRSALLEALSKLSRDDPAWRVELAALVADPDNDVRNAAAVELGRVGSATELAVLAKLLDHPLWSTRLAAVRGIELMRSEAGVPLLIERLAKEQGRLTTDVAATLQRLTGRSFGVYADLWRRWWETLPSDWHLPGVAGAAPRTSVGGTLVREPGGTRVANFFGARVTSQRVAFVVDVSLSMEEPAQDGNSRFENAKDRLRAALSALAPEVQFNLVAFSGLVGAWRARLPTNGVKPEKSGKDKSPLLEQAKGWIAKLRMGPGTNLYGALEVAFSDPEVDTIYLLTDGEPTQGAVIDPAAIRSRVAMWNRHRGVVIHTIAFGGSFPILEWLAEDTGGSYRYIP